MTLVASGPAREAAQFAEGGALTVAINGTGIAANCCAHRLASAGFGVRRTVRDRASAPAILLSDAALDLMRSVFDRPDLFVDRHRITHRIVAWGAGEPVRLPHSAIVVAERDIDATLQTAGSADGPAALTIHAAPPFPDSALRAFGARRTVAAQVRLRQASDQSACWIESVEVGWLFLLPGVQASGWLLAVGGSAEDLLAQSRHIAPRVELQGPTSAPFDTSPRMLSTMAGPDWLACGSSAIAFDPICGDGAAQAVREAVLASAVIGGLAEGGDGPALRMHYQSLMVAAMRRHLRLCAQFYASGGDGPWWRAQLVDLAEGFEACTARLAQMPEPRYALRDDRLVPREQTA